MNIRFALSLAAILATVSGCNLFDPFDSPTSAAQLTSAARACFDKADYTCALENYGKLAKLENATTADLDIAASEQAFVLLDQSGASMGNFLGAFGTGGGNAGAGITKLTTKLAASVVDATAAATIRNQMLQALQTAKTINDQSLRGLVRFVASVSLLSAILGVDANSTGSSCTAGTDPCFSKADLVREPTTCTSVPATCGTGTKCSGPAVSKITTGSGTATVMQTVTNLDGSPTVEMLAGALTELQTAFGELGSGSGLGGSAGAFAGTVLAASLTTNGGACFRATLLEQGIGSVESEKGDN